MIIKNLYNKKLISPPKWLIDNVSYMTITGSEAYGFATDFSDKDIVGFCIPRKDILFPHLAGEVYGFLPEVERFEQFQKHQILDKDSRITYDITVFNIVKFFKLSMDNNPNILELLYTPRNCIQHSTAVGELVRQNRRLFLHKGLFHKYKGYAYSQLGKINNQKQHVEAIRAFEDEHNIPRNTSFQDVCDEFEKRKLPMRTLETGRLSHLTQDQLLDYKDLFENGINEEDGSKRFYSRKVHNYDVKFLTHLVRLCLQGEQLLETGDLDIQRDRELLKDIRKGNWTEQQGREWFNAKEKYLNKLYEECKILPLTPNTKEIKKLLLNCIESHYGNLSDCISIKTQENELVEAIKKIQEIANSVSI